MTAETITFVFPETMDVNQTNVDFTAITLMNSADGAESHTLGDGSVLTQIDSTTIKCKLKLADLNILKTKKIGRDKASTWLHIQAAAFRDQEALQVVPETKNVDNYIADQTDPELEGFDLDLTAETLTLFFSETVSFSSTAVGEITLQSHKVDPD